MLLPAEHVPGSGDRHPLARAEMDEIGFELRLLTLQRRWNRRRATQAAMGPMVVTKTPRTGMIQMFSFVGLCAARRSATVKSAMTLIPVPMNAQKRIRDQ